MQPAPSHPACPYPAMPAPRGIRLQTMGDHGCSYLPGRVATHRAFWAERLGPDLYHDLMDAGFRRSGKVIYQPVCRGCRACQMIRLGVWAFAPSKSQRRSRKKNADVSVRVGEPRASEEKYDLYRRYQADWHGKAEDDRGAFESFLYDSPVRTLEFEYRDGAGKLLAVGICDVCRRSLSSVYLYHDPAESKRSLGTFSALYEIDFAREANIPYYYLGYWVAGCGTMQYKADFRPHELLHPDGVWRPGAPEGQAAPPGGG